MNDIERIRRVKSGEWATKIIRIVDENEVARGLIAELLAGCTINPESIVRTSGSVILLTPDEQALMADMLRDVTRPA